jgi:hypothetical protein
VLANALDLGGTRERQDPEWRSLAFPIPVAKGPRRLAIRLVAIDDPAADATVEAAIDGPRVTLE